MEKSVITFKACATGPGLTLTVKFNEKTEFCQELTDRFEDIKIEFDADSAADHVVEIMMSGKLSEHTVINSSGKIVQDRLIQIKNFFLDGIDLGQVFIDHAVYCHDFNGTGSCVNDQFFGDMGCNGSVYFKFTSPVFIWLLENM